MTLLRHVGLAGSLALAACSPRVLTRETPGVTPPVARCTTPRPTPPPDVVSGELAGVALVKYVVGTDGKARGLSAVDSRLDTRLLEAVQGWLEECSFAPARLDGAPQEFAETKAFAFAPPRAASTSPAPTLTLREVLRAGGSKPWVRKCSPVSPFPFLEAKTVPPFKVELIVHPDGRATDVRLANERDAAFAEQLPLTRLWLESCLWEPARDAAGQAIAVRATRSSTEGAWKPPPLAEISQELGERIVSHEALDDESWQLRIPACATARPLVTDEVRSTSGGLVLMEYVIRKDGSVARTRVRNPTAAAPHVDSVVRYLAGCRFEPPLLEGKPVGVLILQPFSFKPGL